MLQTLVPGATQTCIFLMENLYSLILARISIANFSATVRTAIIHQQQLKIGKRLRQNAVYTFSQVWLNVVYRHYY